MNGPEAAHRPRVRLYGAVVGHGSFARVADGMRQALGALGELAGFVPIDAIDDEAIYPGYDAPIGVYVGPPGQVALMASMGTHTLRWALLPANSTWVPHELLMAMWPAVTGFLAPSMWAAGILAGHVQEVETKGRRSPWMRLCQEGATGVEARAVDVWAHGIDGRFAPSKPHHAALVKSYHEGRFEVLHLASTARERKGTRELVLAWGALVRDGALGKTPTLRLLVDGPDDAFEDVIEDACRGQAAARRSVTRTRRCNLAPAETAELYRQHHAVCQPSRGEGFGLVPLEARASGVVVCATAETGHAAHLPRAPGLNWGGVSIIPMGPLAPIDDGPGAMAPSLSFEHVALSLSAVHRNWETLGRQAQEAALGVRDRHAWTEVTRSWLLGQP